MIVRLAVVALVVAPAVARAECIGFFNQTEQGFRLEGERLRPSGPKIAAGTELEFNGIGRFKDGMYLTRARSDVIFDGQNVELDSKCDLPSRSLPQAR